MIFQAQEKYAINLSKSFMVGDSEKDIALAHNARCAKALLVKTGNGISALTGLIQKQIPPDYVAKDLYDAACWIINATKE